MDAAPPATLATSVILPIPAGVSLLGSGTNDLASERPVSQLRGFNQAKDQVAKLLSLPLYALGSLVSLFVKRDNLRWVFANGSGVGDGVLALYRHVETADPTRQVIWLARNEAEHQAAKDLGLNVCLRSGWQGFKQTLKAGVVVVNGLGDANRYGTRGAFVVQLWHGIPIKKIQFDSPVTFTGPAPFRSILRWLYRRSSRLVRLFPAASASSASRLKSAFDLTEKQLAITGDPRDDAVFGSAPIARELLKDGIGNYSDDRVILYAPTWRDGEPAPAIPNPAEQEAISRFLVATKSVLVVRPHPRDAGNYADLQNISNRTRLLSTDAQHDLNQVLPAVDILVTDYSSAALDFALLGRPIAFLAPDVQDYEKTRGFYEPYQRFTGGSEVATWGELLSLLSDNSELKRLELHAKELARIHHKYHDGNNSLRVFDEINHRLGAKG